MKQKTRTISSPNNNNQRQPDLPNNNWVKKHISEIIVGLIVCFLYPLIVNIWASLAIASQNIGSSLWTILVNVIYIQASKTTDNTLTEFCFTILIGFLLGMSAIPAMLVFQFNELVATKIKNNEEYQNVKIKKMKILSLLSIFIGVCYTISLFVFLIFPVTLKEKFDIQLEKISPYIKQEEVIQLRSDWRQMTSINDYKNLIEKTNKIENTYILSEK